MSNFWVRFDLNWRQTNQVLSDQNYVPIVFDLDILIVVIAFLHDLFALLGQSKLLVALHAVRLIIFFLRGVLWPHSQEHFTHFLVVVLVGVLSRNGGRRQHRLGVFEAAFRVPLPSGLLFVLHGRKRLVGALLHRQKATAGLGLPAGNRRALLLLWLELLFRHLDDWRLSDLHFLYFSLRVQYHEFATSDSRLYFCVFWLILLRDDLGLKLEL